MGEKFDMSAQNVLALKSSTSDLRRAPAALLWEMLNAALQASPSADHLPLSAPGRCLVPDGFHFVCEAVAISARGLKITCEALADPGDAVTVNFRDLGEIRGVVESRADGWFVLDIREPPERLATLSRRLLWSVRRHIEGAAERRMSPRFEQNRRPAKLKTSDGRETIGALLDLSSTGAAVLLDAGAPYFWVGQEVVLDDRAARVRRHFPGGIGVEFDEARELEG
jgi:hypothetical protein